MSTDFYRLSLDFVPMGTGGPFSVSVNGFCGVLCGIVAGLLVLS